MKVAVSANSKEPNQEISYVFGRCQGYVIAEIEGNEVKGSSFIPNPAFSTPMGAGIAAAQAVAAQGVEAVVTGNIGPNAFMVLHQSGIRVYKAGGVTVEKALQLLAEGKLQEITGPNVGGHFGAGPGRGRGTGFRRGRGPPM